MKLTMLFNSVQCGLLPVHEHQVYRLLFPCIKVVPYTHYTVLQVFLDEINTASCLGLLKEVIVDGTFFGEVCMYVHTVLFTASNLA